MHFGRALPRPRQLTWVEVQPAVKKPATNHEEDKTKQRIVQSDAGKTVPKAAPDSYLGEKNRVVDRETVNSRKMIEMGQKGTASAQPKTQTKQNQTAQTKETGKTEVIKASKLGLAILPEDRRKGLTEELIKDRPEWANIGAQSQDYIQGIKESDRTALNTREYLFFGYHQRIRQRLEMEWTRLLKATLAKYYRSGRHLASEREHTTKVVVVLNGKGEIIRVKMLSESGVRVLDDVAVEAFNRAGPFPNPPRGLVSASGEIEVPWELKLRS